MLISIILAIISVVIIILVLLQERGSGLSGIFGGGGEGGFYQKRRGLEKMIFYATIFLIVSYIGFAILNLVF